MSAVRNTILREIENMNEPQLEEVLKAIRKRVKPLPEAMSGAEFIRRFGGLIAPDELDRMEAAIEADCETVEPSDGR